MNFNKVCHPLASVLEPISFSALSYIDEEDFVLQHLANIKTPTSFASACLKRKCEFIAGRLCARDALEKSHVHGFQLIASADRSPTWPEHITGSITHSHNFAAAAVGAKTAFKGIGIDSEAPITTDRLESIKPRLFLPQELALGQQILKNREIYYTIVFSAKESIFKCIYPLTGVFFGFHDAWIKNINWQQHTFEYQLVKSLGPSHPAGKTGKGFFNIDNLVHTAVIECL